MLAGLLILMVSQFAFLGISFHVGVLLRRLSIGINHLGDGHLSRLFPHQIFLSLSSRELREQTQVHTNLVISPVSTWQGVPLRTQAFLQEK